MVAKIGRWGRVALAALALALVAAGAVGVDETSAAVPKGTQSTNPRDSHR